MRNPVKIKKRKGRPFLLYRLCRGGFILPLVLVYTVIQRKGQYIPLDVPWPGLQGSLVALQAQRFPLQFIGAGKHCAAFAANGKGTVLCKGDG